MQEAKHDVSALRAALGLLKSKGWLLAIGVKSCPVILLASEDGSRAESYDAQQAH